MAKRNKLSGKLALLLVMAAGLGSFGMVSYADLGMASYAEQDRGDRVTSAVQTVSPRERLIHQQELARVPACCQVAGASAAARSSTADKLIQAYPDCIASVENDVVVFKNGVRLPFDDGKQKTLAQQYADADIEDQLRARYVKGKTPRPAELDDPGRIRNDTFFKVMYGATPAAVQRNFATITWLPNTAPQQLRVMRINGVDKKLQAISDELEKLPAMLPFAQNAAGTYSWRVIKGTTRLSTHSYGIAIDINTAFSNYWQWDNKTTDESRNIPQYINRIPQQIVDIFEKHGFIWGGKWYHYDTMHFEYRPELLVD